MLYYTAVSGVNVIALLILDYIIRKNNVTFAKAKGFFRLSILATIIAVTAEIATMYFGSANENYRAYNIIANIIGFSASPFIPLLIGCAINSTKMKGTFLFWVPAVLNFILSLFSSKISIIFWVNSDNVYSRGGLFWIYIVAYSIGIIYLFIETMTEINRYQNENSSVLFILFFFVAFGTTIQVAVPQLHVSWICITFATGLYYTYYSELRYQIDGLTELLNRHAFERHICKLTGEKNVAILYFDIDDFKKINDEYGHPFGDYCLTAVSSRIKETFSHIGLCFRIGGDEFCVISKNVDETTIRHANQRFLNEISTMREAETRIPMVSIGYSFYNGENVTVDEAIFEADREMYRYKQERKKQL